MLLIETKGSLSVILSFLAQQWNQRVASTGFALAQPPTLEIQLSTIISKAERSDGQTPKFGVGCSLKIG